MNKSFIVIIGLFVFFLLTDTALERVISGGVWSVGKGVVGETEFFMKDAGTGVLGGIEGLRRGLAYESTYFKNQFKADIARSQTDNDIFSYFMYFLLLFVSLFFVYKLLYYALIILFIFWLYVIIRNRF